MDVWSEWKEHDGGECPIPDAKAGEWEGEWEGLYRSGKCVANIVGAAKYWWGRGGIAHYRTRIPLESLVGRWLMEGDYFDGGKPQAAPEPVPVCSRQAPEAATPGASLPPTTPDREHPCVMVSDEPGIVRAVLAGKMDRLLEACPAAEAKEAPPLPVAGFDHRLGAWPLHEGAI